MDLTPGKKTSEFYGKTVVQVMLATIVIVMIATGNKELFREFGETILLLIAGVEGAYSVSRGLTKRGANGK